MFEWRIIIHGSIASINIIRPIIVVYDTACSRVAFFEAEHLSPARIWPWLCLVALPVFVVSFRADVEDRETCVLVICGWNGDIGSDRVRLSCVGFDSVEVRIGQPESVDVVIGVVDDHAVASARRRLVLEAAAPVCLGTTACIGTHGCDVALHGDRVRAVTCRQSRIGCRTAGSEGFLPRGEGRVVVEPDRHTEVSSASRIGVVAGRAADKFGLCRTIG